MVWSLEPQSSGAHFRQRRGTLPGTAETLANAIARFPACIQYIGTWTNDLHLCSHSLCQLSCLLNSKYGLVSNHTVWIRKWLANHLVCQISVVVDCRRSTVVPTQVA